MAFKRKLRSIKALVTFEAAMRLTSFTAAARELNVTQAAVSRQVRVLAACRTGVWRGQFWRAETSCGVGSALGACPSNRKNWTYEAMYYGAILYNIYGMLRSKIC
jgi:hypothetical protein